MYMESSYGSAWLRGLFVGAHLNKNFMVSVRFAPSVYKIHHRYGDEERNSLFISKPNLGRDDCGITNRQQYGNRGEERTGSPNKRQQTWQETHKGR